MRVHVSNVGYVDYVCNYNAGRLFYNIVADILAYARMPVRGSDVSEHCNTSN